MQNCARGINLLESEQNCSSTFQMKNRPIHENLDTSFVNLSALVRYLRRRQFAGGIRIELSGYEADIILTAENQMKVREYDRIAGRIAEGEDVLQRLLIRAREPGGVIHVYQTIAETEAAKKEAVKVVENKKNVPQTPPIITPETVQTVQVSAVAAQQKTAETKFVTAPNLKPEAAQEVKIIAPPETKPNLILPKFPFELSNKVESKARQNHLSPEDWQTFVNLIGELLQTFDECLAAAKLDFSAAFEKACAEISGDYPFLNPPAKVFSYQNGKIEMREQINPKLFAASINETLRRILEKLAANPKFAEVHRTTAQKTIALINQRKPFYDNFSITPQLEKNLGI